MGKHSFTHAGPMPAAAGAALLVCLLTACQNQEGNRNGHADSTAVGTESVITSPFCVETGTADSRDTESSNIPGVPSESSSTETTSPEAAMWAMINSGQTLQGKRRRLVAYINQPADAPTEQGGCFDGTYWYQAFIRKDTDSNEKENDVYIVKYNVSTGVQVMVSQSLPLHHANDITYNARRHVLVVVHNNPYRTRVSVLDPDSLTIIETCELPMKIYCIDYNEARDEYVVGLSGGQSFCFLNADFRKVSRIFNPTDTTVGYTTQGCGCDDSFLYFVLYNPNVVTIYDWEGMYITTVPLNVPGEPEHISAWDGALYVGTAGVGATLYRVELVEKGT